MEIVIFAGLALVAIVSSLLVIVQRNPVHSALFLVITLGDLAILFVLLQAQFVAVVQVFVYAGAIMVLFLFVIMLLDIRQEPVPWAPQDRGRIGLALALAAVLLLELGLVVGWRGLPGTPGPFPPERVQALGNTQVVGRLLFTDWLFPFELTSVILLVAIVGAMVLAKRQLD